MFNLSYFINLSKLLQKGYFEKPELAEKIALFLMELDGRFVWSFFSLKEPDN